MKVAGQIDSYLLPKAGNSPDELEDAIGVGEDAAGDTLRVAVADGATEGSPSGMWARTLVDAYCSPATPRLPWWRRLLPWRRSTREPDADLLSQARARFAQEQSRYLEARLAAGRPLKWYEERGFEKGAYAAFLGLTLRRRALRRDTVFTAKACGDVCLFQVRGGHLLKSWPISRSCDFGNRPHLVASRQGERAVGPGPAAYEGTLQQGDALYLASDALAAWFLRQTEEGERPWAALDGLRGEGGFERLVAELRTQGALRNDDVALVRVTGQP